MTAIPATQQECPDFRHYAYLHSGTTPEPKQLATKTIAESDQYFLDDDVLFHMFYPRSKGHKAVRMIKQLAVPPKHRLSVLTQYHDDLIVGGHQGQDRMYEAIKRKYFWPGMYKDVCVYVRGCDPCQLAKRYFGFHPSNRCPS